MTTAETGHRGELAAAERLRQEGYEICAMNWRAGSYELDIVASRDFELHIIEVKTRRAGSLTPPEAAITPQKIRSIRHAATQYVAFAGWEYEVRFDLAAVDAYPDGRFEVELIPDVMEAHW